MKKVFLLSVAAAIICAVPAMTGEAESSSVNQEFTFRGLQWYDTKANAEKQLIDSGAEIEHASFEDNIFRMSGIDFISTSSKDERVDGGGKKVRYSGLNVAGYDPSDVYACYMYQLNDDGTINHSVDDALFYFGWYTFDSNDYVDGEGVYNDLSEKLSSLYGEGTPDETDYHSSITWYDSVGNEIRLFLGGKGYDNLYVTLGYMASGADEKLNEMQTAVDNEAIAAEAAEREANKSNMEGL